MKQGGAAPHVYEKAYGGRREIEIGIATSWGF
jgi:hypothetical protein